jgi:hypothetical protein
MREKGVKTRCTKRPVGAAHDINSNKSLNFFFEVRAVRKPREKILMQHFKSLSLYSLRRAHHKHRNSLQYNANSPTYDDDRVAKFFKISGQLWLKKGWLDRLLAIKKAAASKVD